MELAFDEIENLIKSYEEFHRTKKIFFDSLGVRLPIAPTARRQGGKLTSPHRFIWEYLNGAIPENQEVDPLCQNRACANPKHLRLVSYQENQAFLRKQFCKYGHPYKRREFAY